MLTHAKFINLRVLSFGRRMFGTNLQHKLHTYAIFWKTYAEQSASRCMFGTNIIVVLQC